MNIPQELLTKISTAKTPEELLGLVKAEGIELTAEEAAELFEKFHKTVELADEELDCVAGGYNSIDYNLRGYGYKSGNEPIFPNSTRVRYQEMTGWEWGANGPVPAYDCGVCTVVFLWKADDVFFHKLDNGKVKREWELQRA